MRTPWAALLDASIYFSFDRSGYERHARSFREADLRDLTGETCVVTGANSGIGYATAVGLARLGARVHLVCRSEERGRAAVERLRAETGNDDLHLDVLDVSDLSALRDWAAQAAERVDVLVHNAGVLPAERQLSPDGIEATLATHVLGPFLLTHLLRARLEAAPAARVVWVSSGGMYTQRLSSFDLEWARRRYDGVVAYAQTKRMQVVLASLFAERWSGSPIRFHAMHPGWADTPAVQTSLPGFHRFTQGRLRTPEQGADTVVWLAAAEAPQETNGEFWFDREARSPYLIPGKRESRAEREGLWRMCAELTRAGVPTP